MARLAAFTAIAALAIGQPVLAEDRGLVRGAIYPLPQAGGAGLSLQGADNDARNAFVASSMAGALEMAAASHKEEESRRQRINAGGSAEAALLAGAGLLSPASYLVPICPDWDPQPSFDCQIVAKLRKGR